MAREQVLVVDDERDIRERGSTSVLRSAYGS